MNGRVRKTIYASGSAIAAALSMSGLDFGGKRNFHLGRSGGAPLLRHAASHRS